MAVGSGDGLCRGVALLFDAVFAVLLFDAVSFLFLALRFFDGINLERNLVRDLGGGRAVLLFLCLTSCDRDREEMVDGAVVPAESSLVDDASLIRFGFGFIAELLG